MQIILKYLENVMDLRQEKKVLHKMGDIIAIVFFASLANTSDWTEIHYFAVLQNKMLVLKENAIYLALM